MSSPRAQQYKYRKVEQKCSAHHFESVRRARDQPNKGTSRSNTSLVVAAAVRVAVSRLGAPAAREERAWVGAHCQASFGRTHRWSSTPARMHDGSHPVAATLGSGDSNGIADSALAWKQGEPAKWHSRRARAARRRGDKGLGPATADEAQNQHSVDSETPEVAGTGEGALCGRAPTTVNRSQRSSVRTRAQCSVVTRSAVQSRGDPALRHAHKRATLS